MYLVKRDLWFTYVYLQVKCDGALLLKIKNINESIQSSNLYSLFDITKINIAIIDIIYLMYASCVAIVVHTNMHHILTEFQEFAKLK